MRSFVVLLVGAATACGILESPGQRCRVTDEGVEFRESNEQTDHKIPWEVEVGDEYTAPWCSPGDEIVET
jgi:hypothetical protein